MNQPFQKKVKEITGAYTLTLADLSYAIRCNSASPFTITLPVASGFPNFHCDIINVGAGSVTCNSISIEQGEGMQLYGNGSVWTSQKFDALVFSAPLSKTGKTVSIADATASSKGAMQVGNGLNVTSGVVNANTDRVTTKVSSSLLTADEEGLIVCNHSATPIIITLPSASTRVGLWYKIVNIGQAGVLANGISLYSGDSTMFFSDGSQWINYGQIKNRTLYTQTGTETITNTTTETNLIDGGVGTLVVPPNSTRIGDTIRIKMYGYISTGNPSPTSTIRIYYGATPILESSEILPANLSEQYVEFEIIGTARTIGATGTIFMQGRTIFHNGSGVTSINMRQLLNTAPTTIDTTTLETISVTYQWSAARAEDSIVITNSTIELLRP